MNEDGLVITDRYIAVIDGATSSGDMWGRPGGLAAKEIISRTVEEAPSVEDGYEFILYLNHQLYKAQEGNPEAFANPGNRLMASVMVYHIEMRQLWSYGDCRYLVNGYEYGFDKTVDHMNAMLRSYVNQSEILAGRTEEELLLDDTGAKTVRPLIKKQPVFANKDIPFGYPILDGGELCKNIFLCHTLQQGDELVMATDGYPVLRPSLSESENYLVNILKEDPLCIRNFRSVKGCYPGNISYDDRTYIRILV